MSLLSNAFKRLYKSIPGRLSKHNLKSGRGRQCRFEQMEPRQMLSAAALINFGAVYVEVGTGDDTTGDAFAVTFNGGAAGTTLTNLTINLNPAGNTSKFCFFDGSSINVIVGDGGGSIGSNSDITIGGTAFTYDGATGYATSLTLSRISGFTTGDKLVFSIDLDEYDASKPEGFKISTNAEAAGEFTDSGNNAAITVTFVANHYEDAPLTKAFDNYYSTTLPLPDDDYLINTVHGFPSDSEIGWTNTAGALASTEQTLSPVTISGHVYEVSDHDNPSGSVIAGLGGFTVTLYNGEGDPVNSTVTNSQGYYSFTTDGEGHNLLPGEYRIVESQIDTYLDAGDKPGTVGGETRGVVVSDNILGSIALEGGDDSYYNDFYEITPATISGHVYFDANDNGIRESGEPLITESTTITLYDAQNNVVDTFITTDGYYIFTKVMPGQSYKVEETTQPSEYSDGKDSPGTVDGMPMGTAQNPGEAISDITLSYGSIATDYDFGEILTPAAISGKVFVSNDNGVSVELLLPGVTICLYDYKADPGAPPIAVTTTDGSGYYSFTINFLNTLRNEIKVTDANGNSVLYSADSAESAVVFSVVELETADNYILWNGTKYYEGGDQIGSINGVNDANASINGVDRIDYVLLAFGDVGTEYNFYEIEPVTISGYVFQDGPAIPVADPNTTPDVKSLRTGSLTPDDTLLAGVTLQLCDASGYPRDENGTPITTTTDSSGYYEFKNLQPDTYSVQLVTSTLPAGYLTGIDTPGIISGINAEGSKNIKAVNKYSDITASQLSSMGIYGLTASGDAIVNIVLDPGDTASQNNFSVVKIETPPDRPPVFPNPPQYPMLDLPRMPVAPDPFRYGVNYLLPPIIMPQQLTGGSGGQPGYTWHLSVINGGQPRQLQNGEFAANSQSQLFDPDTWTGADVNQGGMWIIADTNGTPVKKYRFGLRGATPVAGDWNGDGVSKIGVFIDGLWFLDLNGNGVWDENDLWAKLGQHGDRPVSGDWDGDGKTDIGIFGPSWFGDPRALAAEAGLPDARNPLKNRYKNIPPEPEDATIGWRTMKRTSAGNLRSDLIDHVFRFGAEDDQPVAGDWNGDGVYAVGIFRNGTWFLDMDGDGRWGPEDRVVEFGQEGDIPVVGDWTGDGISKLGVYHNGTFYLDANNNHVLDATDKVFTLGSPGDIPFAGDFTGSGVDTVGVYHDGGGETVSVPTPAPAKE